MLRLAIDFWAYMRMNSKIPLIAAEIPSVSPPHILELVATSNQSSNLAEAATDDPLENLASRKSFAEIASQNA